jgi:phage portal protein BeeE
MSDELRADGLPLSQLLGYDSGYGQTLAAPGGPVERPAQYADVASVFRSNSTVYSLVDVRVKALSEVRFQFRQRIAGRSGPFFGSPALDILERPAPGWTTRSLVTQMVLDHDLAGTAYVAYHSAARGLIRLRPDWVEIVFESSTGDPNGADSIVAGYIYHPGGVGSCVTPVGYLPEQVALWKGLPDPACRFRGLSWVVPVLGNAYADTAITEYVSRFFNNGASPSMVVQMPPDLTEAQAKVWAKRFTAKHTGVANQHRPVFLTSGATIHRVGADNQQAMLRELAGAGETRLAAAAGVPPVIAGFSEGLSSTSYAAYAASRRRYADYTITPLLNELTEALAPLVTMPPGEGVYLSWDPREISHFQDDAKDAATIRQADAATIAALWTAGFTPESAVLAVTAGDLGHLVHTGSVSVQTAPASANSAAPVANSPAPDEPTDPETPDAAV